MVLFLNDIAGSEILLILVFILMFFGSKSIPGIARTFGRTIRQVKEASQDLQDEIKKSSSDMKKDLNLEGIIEKTEQEIKAPVEKLSNEINNTVSYNKSNFFLDRQNNAAASEEITDIDDGTDQETKASKEEDKK